MAQIEMKNVVKEYRIRKKSDGKWHILKDFFLPEYDIRTAVNDVSLSIEKGEIIGYLGPNGAGKSTSLKILTGIISPTHGKVTINGFEPYLDRTKNAFNIGAVFGHRSQLLWDLPVEDTFELHKKMYRIDNVKYTRNINEFVSLLEMESFIKQPVRQLSLGQKMRANIALALLHDPEILFLDEPTIGLDVVAKSQIREFIKRINKDRKVTVILTTHDTSDIEELCKRLIVIDTGRIVYDGSLVDFKRDLADDIIIRVVFKESHTYVRDKRFTEIARNENEVKYTIDQGMIQTGEALNILAREYSLIDIGLQNVPIEEALKKMYVQGILNK